MTISSLENQIGSSLLKTERLELISGVYWTFYPSGTIKSQTIFVAGKPHGSRKQWHPNERLWKLAEFSNGVRHGKSAIFNRDGCLELELRFDFGQMFYEARYDERGIKSVENWYGGKNV